MARLRSWFPNPVNETSARLVAAGVVAQVVAFGVLRSGWLLVPLVYGFVARVIAGPTLSPLGQVVTRWVTPRLAIDHRLVPGPPKRFAQGMGVAFSVVTAVLWATGHSTLAMVVVLMLGGAALLESAFGICLGCIVFGQLMRWGLIPESTCAECGDISGRLAARRAELAAVGASPAA